MADEKVTAYSDVEKELVRSGSLLPDKEVPRSGSVVPDKILKHSKDADEAMKAFEGHEGESIVLDEATNRRLLRKIDWNILPVRATLAYSSFCSNR